MTLSRSIKVENSHFPNQTIAFYPKIKPQTFWVVKCECKFLIGNFIN
jgi:hypothetical protein